MSQIIKTGTVSVLWFLIVQLFRSKQFSSRCCVWISILSFELNDITLYITRNHIPELIKSIVESSRPALVPAASNANRNILFVRSCLVLFDTCNLTLNVTILSFITDWRARPPWRIYSGIPPPRDNII